jgi:hypothetical protein
MLCPTFPASLILRLASFPLYLQEGVREPGLLRGMVVRIVYAMWVHPEAYEQCKARDIWLNMPDRELIELEQILSRA